MRTVASAPATGLPARSATRALTTRSRPRTSMFSSPESPALAALTSTCGTFEDGHSALEAPERPEARRAGRRFDPRGHHRVAAAHGLELEGVRGGLESREGELGAARGGVFFARELAQRDERRDRIHRASLLGLAGERRAQELERNVAIDDDRPADPGDALATSRPREHDLEAGRAFLARHALVRNGPPLPAATLRRLAPRRIRAARSGRRPKSGPREA